MENRGNIPLNLLTFVDNEYTESTSIEFFEEEELEENDDNYIEPETIYIPQDSHSKKSVKSNFEPDLRVTLVPYVETMKLPIEKTPSKSISKISSSSSISENFQDPDPKIYSKTNHSDSPIQAHSNSNHISQKNISSDKDQNSSPNIKKRSAQSDERDHRGNLDLNSNKKSIGNIESDNNSNFDSVTSKKSIKNRDLDISTNFDSNASKKSVKNRELDISTNFDSNASKKSVKNRELDISTNFDSNASKKSSKNIEGENINNSDLKPSKNSTKSRDIGESRELDSEASKKSTKSVDRNNNSNFDSNTNQQPIKNRDIDVSRELDSEASKKSTKSVDRNNNSNFDSNTNQQPIKNRDIDVSRELDSEASKKSTKSVDRNNNSNFDSNTNQQPIKNRDIGKSTTLDSNASKKSTKNIESANINNSDSKPSKKPIKNRDIEESRELDSETSKKSNKNIDSTKNREANSNLDPDAMNNSSKEMKKTSGQPTSNPPSVRSEKSISSAFIPSSELYSDTPKSNIEGTSQPNEQNKMAKNKDLSTPRKSHKQRNHIQDALPIENQTFHNIQLPKTPDATTQSAPPELVPDLSLSQQEDSVTSLYCSKYPDQQFQSNSSIINYMKEQKSKQQQQQTQQTDTEDEIMIKKKKKLKRKILRDDIQNAFDDLVEHQLIPPHHLRESVLIKLKAECTKAIVKEDYHRGQELKEAELLLKSEINRKKNTNIDEHKRKNLEYRLSQAQERLVKVTNDWKYKMDKFYSQQKRSKQMLIEKHHQEIEALEKDWEDPSSVIPFDKPSAQLIFLMRSQKALALAREFTKAEETKTVARTLAQKETSSALEKMEETYQTSKFTISQRQKKELDCFNDHSQEKEQKLKEQKNLELSQIRQLIQNLQRQLQSPESLTRKKKLTGKAPPASHKSIVQLKEYRDSYGIPKLPLPDVRHSQKL